MKNEPAKQNSIQTSPDKNSTSNFRGIYNSNAEQPAFPKSPSSKSSNSQSTSPFSQRAKNKNQRTTPIKRQRFTKPLLRNSNSNSKKLNRNIDSKLRRRRKKRNSRGSRSRSRSLSRSRSRNNSIHFERARSTFSNIPSTIKPSYSMSTLDFINKFQKLFLIFAILILFLCFSFNFWLYLFSSLKFSSFNSLYTDFNEKNFLSNKKSVVQPIRLDKIDYIDLKILSSKLSSFSFANELLQTVLRQYQSSIELSVSSMLKYGKKDSGKLFKRTKEKRRANRNLAGVPLSLHFSGDNFTIMNDVVEKIRHSLSSVSSSKQQLIDLNMDLNKCNASNSTSSIMSVNECFRHKVAQHFLSHRPSSHSQNVESNFLIFSLDVRNVNFKFFDFLTSVFDDSSPALFYNEELLDLNNSENLNFNIDDSVSIFNSINRIQLKLWQFLFGLSHCEESDNANINVNNRSRSSTLTNNIEKSVNVDKSIFVLLSDFGQIIFDKQQEKCSNYKHIGSELCSQADLNNCDSQIHRIRLGEKNANQSDRFIHRISMRVPFFR